MPEPTTATTLPTLPTEILDLIVSYVKSEPALARLARVSQTLNRIVVPYLYRHLVITRKDASKLFSGLPRSPVRRKHYQYKEEWNDALHQFNMRWGDHLHHEVDPFEEVDEAPCDWTDSEPETDDEQAVPNDGVSKWPRKKAIELADPGSDEAWARKRKLLRYCRSLAVVQVPSKALCHDLLAALDADSIEGEAEGDTDDETDANPDAYSETPEEESNTESSSVLFPHLTHISFGARAVLRLSEDASIGVPYS